VRDYLSLNNEITEELMRRGFQSRSSTSRKIVLNFESNKLSNEIMNYFMKRSYLRILYNILYEEIPITLDEAVYVLLKDEKLSRVLPMSPIRNIYCKCGNILAFYNPYLHRKPRRKKICPKCHRTFLLRDCEDSDNWGLTTIDIRNILDELTTVKLLTSKFVGICNNCSIVKDLNLFTVSEIDEIKNNKLKKYIKNLYCDKCNNHLFIDKIYMIDEEINEIFSKNGYWLEWYIKNMIKNLYPNIPIEQGISVYNDMYGLEVDLMILKNKKLMCFECKAIHPLKRIDYSEVAYLIEMQDFADELCLITTGGIKDRTKSMLQKKGVKILEGQFIEQIQNLFLTRVPES